MCVIQLHYNFTMPLTCISSNFKYARRATHFNTNFKITMCMIQAHDNLYKILRVYYVQKTCDNQIKCVCLNTFAGNPVFSLGYTASVGYNNREQMCATAKKPTSKPLKGSTIVSLSCVQPLVGQYLRISRAQSVIDSFQEDKQNSLILCEVIVWGVIATYIRQGM